MTATSIGDGSTISGNDSHDDDGYDDGNSNNAGTQHWCDECEDEGGEDEGGEDEEDEDIDHGGDISGSGDARDLRQRPRLQQQQKPQQRN
eukprot:2014019-Alexandrium_andersonii.AAC.1